MNRLKTVFAALFVLLFASLAMAEEIPTVLTTSFNEDLKGEVSGITSATTITLYGGQIVHLAEITVPKKYEAEAKAWLTTALKGKSVICYVTKSSVGRQNRYNQKMAQVVISDGFWVQQDMIRKGFALTYTTPSNFEARHDLLKAENAASTDKSGIWKTLNIQSANKPETLKPGEFSVIEGVVKQVSDKSDWIFINFGDDWKNDFTVVIEKNSFARFKAVGVDPQSYLNQTLRVRGVIEMRNGPMITVTTPMQIDLI